MVTEDVLADLKAFGCTDGVMSLVRDLPDGVPVVRLPSKAKNYVALSCAEGHQVALYVHTTTASIALDAERAEQVATATGAGLHRRNDRTGYLVARAANLPSRDLSAAAAEALRRSQHLIGPDDPLHSLEGDAYCPEHHLLLPLTGECQC